MLIRSVSLLKLILMAKPRLTSMQRIPSPGGFACLHIYTHRNCFIHHWHSAITVCLEQASSPVKCHFIICLSCPDLLDFWHFVLFWCYNVLNCTSSNLRYIAFFGKNIMKLIYSGKECHFLPMDKNKHKSSNHVWLYES